MPSWMSVSELWQYQAHCSAITYFADHDDSSRLEWILQKVRLDENMWKEVWDYIVWGPGLRASTIKVADWLLQQGVPFVWEYDIDRADIHLYLLKSWDDCGVDTEQSIQCMEWVCSRGYVPSQAAIDFASSHCNECFESALLRMQTRMQ